MMIFPPAPAWSRTCPSWTVLGGHQFSPLYALDEDGA